MECKKCGFKNKGGSAYCTQCGEKLPDVKFRNFVIIVGVLLFCFILFCVTKRNNVKNNSNNNEEYVTPEKKLSNLVKSKLRSYQNIVSIKEDSETKKYILEINYNNSNGDFYDCAYGANMLSKDLVGYHNIKEIDFTCNLYDEIKYINYIDFSSQSNLENSVTYYDEMKNIVDTSLDKLLDNRVIDYKNKCENLSYKDVLRNPENYKNRNAYWFGEIVQVVSKSSYSSIFRIDVDCEKLHYSGGYLCTDTIYVVYNGSESFIEDDMVSMWGTMDGTQTYTSVLGSQITIPKFQAKYMELK